MQVVKEFGNEFIVAKPELEGGGFSEVPTLFFKDKEDWKVMLVCGIDVEPLHLFRFYHRVIEPLPDTKPEIWAYDVPGGGVEYKRKITDNKEVKARWKRLINLL